MVSLDPEAKSTLRSLGRIQGLIGKYWSFLVWIGGTIYIYIWVSDSFQGEEPSSHGSSICQLNPAAVAED